VLKTANTPSRLIHPDLQEAMELIVSTWGLPSLLDRIEAVHRTLRAISPITGNANTKLALEAMMLSWAEG